MYEQTAAVWWQDWESLITEYENPSKRNFFFQGFIEKAVLSVSEEEKEKERVREDSIRADYKHKSPLCPLHSNLDSDVVQ